MTIHDILVNCGSVQSDTLIMIISATSWVVQKRCYFKNLEPKYEILHFNYFTVSFRIRNDNPKLVLQFYV